MRLAFSWRCIDVPYFLKISCTIHVLFFFLLNLVTLFLPVWLVWTEDSFSTKRNSRNKHNPETRANEWGWILGVLQISCIRLAVLSRLRSIPEVTFLCLNCPVFPSLSFSHFTREVLLKMLAQLKLRSCSLPIDKKSNLQFHFSF